MSREADAIDGQAKAFYERHGFLAHPNDPLHLYLPMATRADALGEEGVG